MVSGCDVKFIFVAIVIGETNSELIMCFDRFKCHFAINEGSLLDELLRGGC